MEQAKTASDIYEKIQELQETAQKKWKVQSVVSKTQNGKCKCICVAYYDARIVVEHLSESFGFLGWQREHFRIDGKEYCRIKVKNPENNEWLNFEDTGVKSFAEAEKGETSDSFKRAAVNLGIGILNYSGKPYWVEGRFKENTFNGKTKISSWPVDSKGSKIYDLTLHINNNLKNTDKNEEQGKLKDVNLEEVGKGKILDEIEALGEKYPYIFANCENHAIQQGFKGVYDCRDGLLASYLVRLQQEDIKEKKDQNLIKPIK